MKIRIQDNSIRLRLSRSEVQALAADGRVASVTQFPGGPAFHYRVESSPASVMAVASFIDGCISVRLPERSVLAWAASEQVSLSGEQMLENGEQLILLIEKDFACLTPREGEDESDLYEHPLAAD